MINEEPNDLGHIAINISELSRRCVPAKFTELLGAVEGLKSVAITIAQLEDEDQQVAAVSTFRHAELHFYRVVADSYSTHLLHITP